MPYIYSEEDVEWPEDAGDDYEPPSPTPDDFQYLPPPEFGGAKDPVRFANLKSGKPVKPQTGPKPPLLMRLLSWALIRGIPGGKDILARDKEERARAAEQRAKLFGIMIPALKDLGGRQVHCIYDGGNDEGFAWFGHLQTDDGQLSLDEVCDRLTGTGLVEQLKEAQWVHDSPDYPRSEREHLHEVLNYSLAEEWAVLLLGWGFGTGPFSMYGAFTADLYECTIVDDREATVPEDGNIEISLGEN